MRKLFLFLLCIEIVIGITVFFYVKWHSINSLVLLDLATCVALFLEFLYSPIKQWFGLIKTERSIVVRASIASIASALIGCAILAVSMEVIFYGKLFYDKWSVIRVGSFFSVGSSIVFFPALFGGIFLSQILYADNNSRLLSLNSAILKGALIGSCMGYICCAIAWVISTPKWISIGVLVLLTLVSLLISSVTGGIIGKKLANQIIS